MKHIRTILVALAAVSLVGMTGCPEDDPSDDGDNGDQMDAAMDTEQPDPDVSEDTEQPDDVAPDMNEMEDVQEDMSSSSDDTIYDVSDGTISADTLVTLEDVVVTAVNEDEIFLQETGGDTAYSGVSLDLFNTPSTMPARGDMVTVENAKVTDQYGFRHLRTPEADGTSLSITVQSSGNTLPDPVVVEPSAIWTGASDSTRREELMGVLISVENVTTVNTNPDDHPTDSSACNSDFNEWAVWSQDDAANAPQVTIGGGGDCSETMITTGLRLDDLFFSDDPSPSSQVDYDSITGPLYWSFSNSKILPRDSNDIVEAGGS